MSQDVIIIGCSKKKLSRSAKAKELYQGTLFKRGVALAEQDGRPWYILSGKYGLLDPDEIIDPYDSFIDMDLRKAEELLTKKFNSIHAICGSVYMAWLYKMVPDPSHLVGGALLNVQNPGSGMLANLYNNSTLSEIERLCVDYMEFREGLVLDPTINLESYRVKGRPKRGKTKKVWDLSEEFLNYPPRS